MCGIAGIVAPRGRLEPQAIEKMVAAMRHRGPDDAGTRRIEGRDVECWLGSTRLSIIDLSAAGHMPMADAGSRNWITYNGEIYNFPVLRERLEARGERFASRTDTETIVKLYRHEGARCVESLRGMFAFAVWDDDRSELFVARDRVGKKPLYYTTTPDQHFVFASDVRALLASGLVPPRLDSRALEIFLANGFVVSPLTLIRNVRALLPGHWMRVGADGRIREVSAYWRPPRAVKGEADTTDERLERMRSLFREAVVLRLISDVPIGVFLSGGIDSTSLLGALRAAGLQVSTFSVTFPEREYDEGPYSRRAASYWNTQHIEVRVSGEEFYRWLPGALASMDQPTFDGVNTYLVSRAAREAGLKVCLSGIGADELFGGYPFFKAVPLLVAVAPFAARVPTWLRRGVLRLLAGEAGVSRVTDPWKALELVRTRFGGNDGGGGFQAASYQITQLLFPAWAREALLPEVVGAADRAPWRSVGLPEEFSDFLRPDLEGLDLVSAFSMLAWRLFLGERCLRDVDAMSMGVSLEVRAPFTDHLLVEEIMRLPGRVRCARPPDKPFEQRLLEPFLLGAWTPRRKQGFVMPFRRWLGGAAGASIVQETLGDGALLRTIGLRPEVVESLWRLHQAHPSRVPWSRAWALYVLGEWCRRHKASL